MTSASFKYEVPTLDCRKSYCARLPREIHSKQELLDALSQTLQLPSYFGFNWDALFECLTDFHWIKEHDVVLIHDQLPALIDHELKVYLGILSDAVFSWKDSGEHQLVVVFNKSDEEKILRITAAS